MNTMGTIEATNLESIYSLKMQIAQQKKRGNQESIKVLKNQLFWQEIMFLFMQKALFMDAKRTVIKITVELNKMDNTVLYRYHTDMNGQKNVFKSEEYTPDILWDTAQSPIPEIGFIKKPLSSKRVQWELGFPV